MISRRFSSSQPSRSGMASQEASQGNHLWLVMRGSNSSWTNSRLSSVLEVKCAEMSRKRWRKSAFSSSAS
jgi:hypothetical protein